MKELLDKLSSYNLFNYLLPGVIFVLISKAFTGYDFTQADNLVGIFLYYFIGMIVSRVGSIVIGPFLQKITFVKYADYKKFVIASKKDEKVNLFSEINNTYRTIIAMLVLLFVLKFYKYAELKFAISAETSFSFAVILILIMFLFSYRKQTSFIIKRIGIE